jgi:pimeloyl-CoA synthetase
VRVARSYKATTCAWKDVRLAQEKIRKHVRAYRRARKALEQLGASEEVLEKYKPIMQDDLRMSGDVVEENRTGQRSDALAWFWHTGDVNLDQENNWMNECMQSS